MSDDTHPMFAHCVRNALRRKPTVIRIGDGDKARIEGAVEAALEGSFAYTHHEDEIQWVYVGTKED